MLWQEAFFGNHKELWKILNAFGEHLVINIPLGKEVVFYTYKKWGKFALIQIFVSILWCCLIGGHPQGDLTTFGYSSAMKVKNY
jgi:hypothetical protein